MTFGPLGSVVHALRKTTMGKNIPHFLAMSSDLLLRRCGGHLTPTTRALLDIWVIALSAIAKIPI
jgi:hypothetical protein